MLGPPSTTMTPTDPAAALSIISTACLIAVAGVESAALSAGRITAVVARPTTLPGV